MNNKRLVIPIDKNCKKKNILLQNEKAVPQHKLYLQMYCKEIAFHTAK